MKNIILACTIFTVTVAAHAQIGVPVSSPKIVAEQQEAGKEPASVIAMGCCTVSMPVSAPQMAQADEGEGSLSMAGLGFGLVGLIGVGKAVRRKNSKREGIGGA